MTGRVRLARPGQSARLRVLATAIPYVVAAAALLFFLWRVRFGLTAIGFNDEDMHLLGGWALNSGEILYRDFVDVHGPGIFMLAQIYGALFGFAHANSARLVIAGFAVLAGVSVATSPGLRGAARGFGAALYFGLLACVWLVQGLYWFSYYPVSGALAVITLAWFTLPACAGARIPGWAAVASGAASVMLAFTSYSEAPSALLFSAVGALAAWQGGQRRLVYAHFAGFVAAGSVLLVWLLVFGDVLGYLAFHFFFGQTAYQKIGPVTLDGLIVSLTPSLAPDRLVQSAAILFGAIGIAAAGWLARRSLLAGAAVAATLAGLVLLDVRGLSIFQDGAMLMAAIGLFAVAVPAALIRVRARPPAPAAALLAGAACLLTVGLTDAVLRRAIASPSGLSRAAFLAMPPVHVAQRRAGPLFDAIRRLTRPDEHILVLVYRPDIYWSAGRLPISGLYEYLPFDAVYAKSPFLGETRDLCTILAKRPPKVIVFDDWVVWGTYKPADYMPCLLTTLAHDYTYVPEPGDAVKDAPKLYVRTAK